MFKDDFTRWSISRTRKILIGCWIFEFLYQINNGEATYYVQGLREGLSNFGSGIDRVFDKKFRTERVWTRYWYGYGYLYHKLKQMGIIRCRNSWSSISLNPFYDIYVCRLSDLLNNLSLPKERLSVYYGQMNMIIVLQKRQTSAMFLQPYLEPNHNHTKSFPIYFQDWVHSIH